jgi:hypothetical protein
VEVAVTHESRCDQLHGANGCNKHLVLEAELQRLRGIAKRRQKEVDTLVAKVRDAIDRLNELRTALISAAVTGKIDGRAS